MPEIGIIGFERSGKTSLFNAITGADRPVGFSTHVEPHVGVVKVPDERLDKLAALYHPKRTTYATLQFIDIPGAGFAAEGAPDTRFLDQLSLADALVHVVRGFQNDAVPHPDGVDAVRDIESMDLELAFADVALIDKRLERIGAETKAMKSAERETAQREAALLQRLREQLDAGTPVRAAGLSEEERRSLAQYRFLTERPLLTVVNVGESDVGEASSIAERLRPDDPPAGTEVAALCASLEMELTGLSPDDAQAYRGEVGAPEGALAQALRLSYSILGLLSFFTVGEDECRAWTITRGDTAPRASGKIHSDMERGFIRAEVVNWSHLLEAGSEAEARKRAQLRTEGKDYVVGDGDVLHVLFNV